MIKAEYIWVDGTEPTQLVRSKTKILPSETIEPPIWGFDGSSTNQAPGEKSDCVLKPVALFRDPTRDLNNDILVMCSVFNTDMKPHASNKRALSVQTFDKFSSHVPLFGIEQEYTFFKGGRPLGFPESGFPGPQGPYYCGVGAEVIFGREIVEEHLEACLSAGLGVSGINAEVMPGQWEFQIGPLGLLDVSDQLWVARWLLYRIAEKHGVMASLDPKPAIGDWNGAGAHCNFSTLAMRKSYDACVDAAEALSKNADLHIANYGHNIESRLTGRHETCSYKEFKWGDSDRGASVRIPWHVKHNDKGYIEDRRPNANCDPYVVTRLLTETVCNMEAEKENADRASCQIINLGLIND